jgi:putative ABC transport system permease protein
VTLATFDRLRLFNIRELTVHLWRTTMAVTVTAVSAALLVAVLGISSSVTGSVDDFGSSVAGNADLEVSGVADTGFPQSLQPAVAGVPGVQTTIPMIRTQVATLDGRLLLMGLDVNSTGDWHSDVQRAALDQTDADALQSVPNGVLVGPNTGKQVGQPIRVGAADMTVAAVIGGPAMERLNNGNFVMAPLAVAQQLANRPGSIDSMLVVAASGADLTSVRTGIDDAVQGRAGVGDTSFRAAQASGVIAVLQALTVMAAGMGLVVAGLLIYNAMSMAVNQRRNKISILRAIGCNSRVIVRDLLVEAALLGLVGGIVGTAVGILMGRWSIGLLPKAFTQGLEMDISYSLPLYAPILALCACVIASVVASAIAARQVYKVEPVESLAPVGVTSADTVSRSLRVAAALLGTSSIAVSIAAANLDVGMWSIAAVAMFLNGSVILGFTFFDQLVAATAAVARRIGAPGAVAAATIERAPRRIWVTVISVMIAVAMSVSINGSSTNGVDSAAATYQPAGDVNAWVQGTTSDVLPTGPVLPLDLEQKVAGVPGVARVVPGQMAYASIGGAKVIVQGLASGTHHPLYEAMSEATRLKVLAGEGVVVSRDIARRLDVRAGDRLTIPTLQGFQRVPVLEVVPYFSALTGFVAASLPDMQRWFERPGATLLEVTFAPGADDSAVRQAIAGVVPSSAHVYSGREIVDGLAASLQQSTVLIRSINWIVVFVAAVALVNTMMLSVLERRRELGVLRAMGSSRKFTLRTVLVEAGAIGFVGSVFGLVVGLLNQYIDTLAFTEVLGFDIAFRIGWAAALFGSAAFALCLAGAIPPALRAARLNVIEAISVD